MCGALRSAYIHAKSDFAAFAAGSDEELSKWMGTPSSYGKFAIKGVVLQDEQDMALPLPLDHQVVLGISGSATANAYGSSMSQRKRFSDQIVVPIVFMGFRRRNRLQLQDVLSTDRTSLKHCCNLWTWKSILQVGGLLASKE